MSTEDIGLYYSSSLVIASSESLVMESEAIVSWLSDDIGYIYISGWVGDAISHQCDSCERDRSDQRVVSIGIDSSANTTEIDQDLALGSDGVC